MEDWKISNLFHLLLQDVSTVSNPARGTDVFLSCLLLSCAGTGLPSFEESYDVLIVSELVVIGTDQRA
jgi:hypothetical protein